MANEWLLVNLIAYPLKVIGVDQRVGIWTQGCSLHCNGCMSRHTWEFDASKKLSVKEVLNRLQNYPTRKITISGGEPLEQKYMLSFLKALKEKGYEDILLYSGYEKDTIYKNHSEILRYIDVLVCGAFIEGLDTKAIYKGSKNQEMIILNDKLKKIYLQYEQKEKNKKLQRFGNTIVGIPYQKDLKALDVM
jgi:anaerobic ribonucleoside-triphosphate reductase activating protein